tara:strand:- start:259 stop:375 length:117 start_codon:yes stop_codon:yes gene_type:complete
MRLEDDPLDFLDARWHTLDRAENLDKLLREVARSQIGL